MGRSATPSRNNISTALGNPNFSPKQLVVRRFSGDGLGYTIAAMNHAIVQHRLLIVVCFVACICLAGCSQQEKRPTLQGDSSSAVDFSGFWELDYSQSDNIQAKLNTLVRELQSRSGSRAPSGGYYQRGGTVMVGGASGPNSAPSIIGLAQMADLITQSQLLEIDQDTHNIKIKRELDFALNCEFYAGQFHTVETPLGSEACGWSGHQLVFRIVLPEGLSIQHVFSLGPERQWLNVATTVVSDQVTSPFTVNRVFARYEPQDSGYSCKMTISRGRVCTTESQ